MPEEANNGGIIGLADQSCGLQEREQSQLTVSREGENLAGNKYPSLLPLPPIG